MPNTQYPSYPMQDWSSEISRPQSAAPAAAAASTTTTTTTTASSSGGQTTVTGQSPAASSQTPMTGSSMQNAGSPPAASRPMQGSPMQGTSGQTPAMNGQQTQMGQAMTTPARRNEFDGSVGTLDLQTHQPIEVIEAPATMNEAFLGSLKSMLLRNRGNFVTATFLIGTQGTTAWEGILHDVGNDYVIIFQPGRQRYIACDIYSLKYIEFYDTRRQEMCESLLRQNGWQNQY